MPKISIIVPIYNLESDLPKCIDSILAQTFTDFEAILVNDGSTDSCGDICKEYALKDNRIVVIQKENGGVSSARNAALDIAKGEYIGFVDSDDYIATDMYSFLYKNMIEKNADISICSFYRITQNGQVQQPKPAKISKYMESEEAIRTLLSRRHFENYLWDKLYKRSLFDGIRFPENQIYEDIAVMYKLFDKCRSVIYVSEPKYYYVQRQGSTVNSGFNLEKMKFVEEYQKIMEFSTSKGGIYDEEARSCYIVSNLWLIYENSISDRKKYNDVLNILCKNMFMYYEIALKSKYIRKFDKFSIILLKHGVSINIVNKIHTCVKRLYCNYQAFKTDLKENKNGSWDNDISLG